jgi:hypothetical protein
VPLVSSSSRLGPDDAMNIEKLLAFLVELGTST